MNEDGEFYEVERPDLLEDDPFVDIMLEEAKKQMKIYMILNSKDKETLAKQMENEKLSMILGDK